MDAAIAAVAESELTPGRQRFAVIPALFDAVIPGRLLKAKRPTD